MKKIIFVLLLCFTSINAQDKYSISGTIKDAGSGETLIGVSIFDQDNYQGTVSNEYGFYSLSLTKGSHNIQISYIGYNNISKTINLNKDQTLNFSLVENVEGLEEIVLTTISEKISIKKAEMSVNKNESSNH